MISIRIPKKETEVFNLFAFGNVIDSIYLDEYGTMLSLNGICVLDYSYPNSRCQYIIRERTDSCIFRRCLLPNVDKEVELIGCFTAGRKIDFLRNSMKNLEKMYGKSPYELPSGFWLKVLAMVENVRRCKNTDGIWSYKNYCSKQRLKALAEEYGLKEIQNGKVS